MDTLCDLLKESIELYKLILDLEYKKYDAVIKNDIKTLDQIVLEEQVCYMKIRGIEQKREKFLHLSGISGKTLKEIIALGENDALKELYEELNKIIVELNKINGLLKTVIEAHLRRIDKAMIDLGEKEHTYNNGNSKKDICKSLLISEKI